MIHAYPVATPQRARASVTGQPVGNTAWRLDAACYTAGLGTGPGPSADAAGHGEGVGWDGL